MKRTSGYRKRGGLRWILVTVAILLLSVGVTASITKGFKDWNPYGWLKPVCVHEYDNTGKCLKCGNDKPDVVKKASSLLDQTATGILDWLGIK